MRHSLACLALAVLCLSGCSGLTPLAVVKPAAPPPAAPGDYPVMGFDSVFESSVPGVLARLTGEFDTIEDTVLDLPEEYAAGWLRIILANPSAPSTRSANVVVPDRNRRFLTELGRGQRLDLLVRRSIHKDPMLNGGAPTVVLQVEQLRRHVDGGDKPQAAQASAAPVPQAPLIFVNERSKDDRLKLLPDGAFELRQGGKDISGTYEQDGERLAFILAAGKRAIGKRGADTVTDPDGKTWVLERTTALAASTAPAEGPLVFVNARSKDDRIRLLPGGDFELRQHGKDIAGRYELDGERLTFVLPNGRRALGKRAAESLTDPDGKTWTLEKAVP